MCFFMRFSCVRHVHVGAPPARARVLFVDTVILLYVVQISCHESFVDKALFDMFLAFCARVTSFRHAAIKHHPQHPPCRTIVSTMAAQGAWEYWHNNEWFAMNSDVNDKLQTLHTQWTRTGNSEWKSMTGKARQSD